MTTLKKYFFITEQIRTFRHFFNATFEQKEIHFEGYSLSKKLRVSFSSLSFLYSFSMCAMGAVMAQLVEYSTPDWRTRVRGCPCEKPPCALMAPGVRHGCNVLHGNSHPNYVSGSILAGKPTPPWQTKNVMAYLRIILKGQSQTVANYCSRPTLNKIMIEQSVERLT